MEVHGQDKIIGKINEENKDPSFKNEIEDESTQKIADADISDFEVILV